MAPEATVQADGQDDKGEQVRVDVFLRCGRVKDPIHIAAKKSVTVLSIIFGAGISNDVVISVIMNTKTCGSMSHILAAIFEHVSHTPLQFKQP